MSMWRVETPEPVFVDWAYRIEPYHYPALGMAKREYVVREIPEPGKKPLKNVVLDNFMKADRTAALKKLAEVEEYHTQIITELFQQPEKAKPQ